VEIVANEADVSWGQAAVALFLSHCECCLVESEMPPWLQSGCKVAPLPRTPLVFVNCDAERRLKSCVRRVSYKRSLPHRGRDMPSASYYRRQAELLLSVAKATENPLVSNRCSLLAEEYQSIAAMLGDDEPASSKSALEGRRAQAHT
jgi:hypothetical protein